MKTEGEIVTSTVLPGTQGIEEIAVDRFPPNPSCLGVNKQLIGKAKSVVIWPDPILSEKCLPVTEFDDTLGQLLMDLVVTMNARKGIGLAAPQIGINQRVLVVLTGNGPLGLINPKVVEGSGRFKTEEGCLSVPGYFDDRTRNQNVDISYVDTYNRERSRNFQGLVAFAIQHEIDHLNGVTFVDELSNLKKPRIKKKITKTLRG